MRSNFWRSLRSRHRLTTALWLAALVLHAVSCVSAGPFWLDEADSVSVARLPWPQLWHTLSLDTFPLGHVALFKFWLAALSFWPAETALRVLGFLVGAGVATGAYAWEKRFARADVPLFFALFQLNPAVVRYIDSARPYGLSSLCFVLLLFNMRAALESGRRRSVILAIVAAFGAVHLHYFNALGVAALLLTLVITRRQSRFPRAATPMIAGLTLALLSMLIYAPVLRLAATWLPLTRQPAPDSGLLLFALNWLLSGMSASPAIFWMLITPLAVALLAMGARRSSSLRQQGRAEFWLWSASLPSLLLLGAMFLGRTNASPWYFIPTVALVSLSLEPAWHFWPRRAPGNTHFRFLPPARRGLQIAAACIALFQICDGWAALRQPMATIDRAAQLVAREATPQDLILVTPWPSGATFRFYYRGQAPFITVPPLTDYAIVRFDLAGKALLETRQSLAPRLAATLRAGHRVFVVGQFETALAASAAPDSLGRDAAGMKRARRAAEAEIAAFLSQHASKPQLLLPQTECFSSECPSVRVYRGWRSGTPSEPKARP